MSFKKQERPGVDPRPSQRRPEFVSHTSGLFLNVTDVLCLNVGLLMCRTENGSTANLVACCSLTARLIYRVERKGRHNSSRSVTKPNDHREETTLCVSYLTQNTHTHRSNVSVRHCDKEYFTVCLKMNRQFLRPQTTQTCESSLREFYISAHTEFSSVKN